MMDDLISRQKAIDAFSDTVELMPECYARDIIADLPSAHQTLYGYDIEHLKLIANVLKKENLPPERVADALMDIGRIVDIVRDEFEETLRKAVEQCMI